MKNSTIKDLKKKMEHLFQEWRKSNNLKTWKKHKFSQKRPSPQSPEQHSMILPYLAQKYPLESGKKKHRFKSEVSVMSGKITFYPKQRN